MLRTLALLIAVGMIVPSVAAVPTADSAPRCLLRSVVETPLVLDDGRVLFQGRPDRRRAYTARFKGRCVGLDRFATVTVEAQPLGYCRGDRLRVVRLPVTIPGPVCVLDGFEPVDGRTLP